MSLKGKNRQPAETLRAEDLPSPEELTADSLPSPEELDSQASQQPIADDSLSPERQKLDNFKRYIEGDPDAENPASWSNPLTWQQGLGAWMLRKADAAKAIEDPVRYGKTMGEHGLNQLSANNYPEINAGLTTGLLKVLGEEADYDQIKQGVLDEMAKNREWAPGAAGTGEIGGAAAQMWLLGKVFPSLQKMGVLPPKYTGRLARAGKAGLMNVGLGFATHPERKERLEGDPTEFEDRISQAMWAAALGVPLQWFGDDLLMHGLSNENLRQVAQKLRGSAYDDIYALMRPTEAMKRKHTQQSSGVMDPAVQTRQQAIGQTVMEETKPGWLATRADVIEKIDDRIGTYYDELEQILNGRGLDEAATFVQSLNPNERAEFVRTMNEAGFSPREAAKEVWEALNKANFAGMTRSDNVSTKHRVLNQLRQFGRMNKQSLMAAEAQPLYPRQTMRGQRVPDPQPPGFTDPGMSPGRRIGPGDTDYSPFFDADMAPIDKSGLPMSQVPDEEMGLDQAWEYYKDEFNRTSRRPKKLNQGVPPGPDVADSAHIPGADPNKIFDLNLLTRLKRRLRNLKTSDWAKMDPDRRVEVTADMLLGDRVQGAIEDISSRMNQASGGVHGDIAETNRRLGNLVEAQKAVGASMLRDSGRPDGGLYDEIFSTAASLSPMLVDSSAGQMKGNSANPGTLMGRLGAALYNKMLAKWMSKQARERGAAFSANSKMLVSKGSAKVADVVEMATKMIQEDPGMFGRFARPLKKAYEESPEAFYATVVSLMGNEKFHTEMSMGEIRDEKDAQEQMVEGMTNR